MIIDIIITLLLISLVFHTYQLREQIEELRKRQDQLFMRVVELCYECPRYGDDCDGEFNEDEDECT